MAKALVQDYPNSYEVRICSKEGVSVVHTYTLKDAVDTVYRRANEEGFTEGNVYMDGKLIGSIHWRDIS